MENKEEIIRRLDDLEGKSRRPLGLLAKYLVFPLVLAVAAYYFNWRLQTSEQELTRSLEEAKQSFQMLELEVRRIEAAQKFVQELFSGTPERAMLSEKMLSRLIDDEELSRGISRTVEQYYKAKISASLESRELESAREIQAAASRIKSPAGRAILSDKYFVIVQSTKDREEAENRARKLEREGYRSEVILSTTGYYGVSLGRYGFQDAVWAMEKAQGQGLAPADSYLMSGERVEEYIFPD